MTSRSRRRENASVLLDHLFDDPDLAYDMDEEELLEGIDRVSLREEIVERLSEPLGNSQLGVVMRLFETVGLGKAKGDLARIVGDRGWSNRSRSTAATVLIQFEPAVAQKVMEKLNEEDLRMIEQAPIRRLLSLVIEDPIAIAAVSDLLRGDGDGRSLEVFERIEAARRGMGLFPMQVYQDVFFDDPLEEMIEPVVARIIEERDPTALEILRFIEGNRSGETRGYWRKIADRVESEIAGQPPADVLPVRAWLSYPMHPFPATLFLVVENPEGTNTFGLTDLGESPTGEEGGFVIYDPEPEVIESIPGPPDSVALSPGIARAVFDRYYEALDDEQIEHVSPGFDALMPHLPFEELPRVPERATEVSEDEVQALFEELPYRKWILDMRIVTEEMEQPESYEALPPEWLGEATTLLEETGQADQLADAFDLMALINLIDGNEERAAFVEALADRIREEGLAFGGIAALLLPRTFAELRDAARRIEEGEIDPWAVEPHEEAELLKILTPVVKKQLKDREVPFVRDTFERLRSEGMSSRDATRAIALQLAAEIKRMTATEENFDEDAYLARLDALHG